MEIGRSVTGKRTRRAGQKRDGQRSAKKPAMGRGEALGAYQEAVFERAPDLRDRWPWGGGVLRQAGIARTTRSNRKRTIKLA